MPGIWGLPKRNYFFSFVVVKRKAQQNSYNMQLVNQIHNDYREQHVAQHKYKTSVVTMGEMRNIIAIRKTN